MQLNTQKELESFFQEHYKNAVIQASRIVKDQGTGEDLVQDCFVKLWEKRKEINTPSLSGYFSKMVKNKCLDYLRIKKPVMVVPEDDQFHSEDHSLLEYEELSDSVNKAIDNLPERCRQIFVLSRFEQLSYKEIAKTLDISPKTVENQISKALKRLGKVLNRFSVLWSF